MLMTNTNNIGNKGSLVSGPAYAKWGASLAIEHHPGARDGEKDGDPLTELLTESWFTENLKEEPRRDRIEGFSNV
jgi:hypothetical protein